MFSINYRGLTIDVTIDDSTSKIEYIKNSNKYVVVFQDRLTNKFSKDIQVPYSITVFDSADIQLTVKNYVCRPQLDVYNYFYNKVVSGLGVGQYLDRGSVNVVLEDIFNEQVYPFNVTDNYNTMQPIIYDLSVLDDTLTVTLVNYDNTKTIVYSLDATNFQSENTFTGLTTGLYTVYVKTLEEGYLFNKKINIA